MSEEEGDEAVSEDVQIEAPNQGVEEEHQESEEEKGISHVEPKPWSGFVDLPIGQGGMLVKVSVDPSCPRWVSFIFNDDTYYFDRFLNGDFTIYESKENKDSAEEDGEEGEGAKDATQDQEELVADQDTPEPFDHRLRFVITRRDASSGDDETSYILMKENTAHEDPNTSGNDEASDRNEVDEASSKSSEEEQFRDITLDVLSIAILYSQHVAFKCIELGADLQVYTEWLQRSLTSQSYIMIERLCQVASHRKGTLSMNYDWIFHSSRLCVTQEGDDMSQTLTRSLTRLLESSISPTQHIPSTSQLLSRHEEFRLYLNVLMKVPLKNFSNWSRTSDEDASDDMANDSSMMLPSFFVECVKLLRRYVARLNNHRKQPYRVPFEEAFEALTQTVQFSGSEDELFLDRFSWCMFYPHSLSIRYSDILLILLALHSPRITYTAFTRLLTRKNTVLLSTLKRNLGKPWPSTPELLFSFAHCHHSSDFLLWAIKNWEPSKVPLHGIVDFGRFFSNLARLRTQTGDVEVAPDDRCLQHLCQWFYIETENIKQLAQACARGTAIPSCFMKALEHLNMKMNNLSALLIQWARTSCDLEQTKIETQYTEYLNDFCDTFCHAFSHFLPRLMHVAISEQVPRAVQLLLNRGCHLTWPPLYPNACDAFPEALEKGTHEVVAMFLKAGHSLNITWNNNRCDGIECLQRRFPNKTVIDLTTIWMENQKIAQNNKDQLFGLICNRANSIKRN